METPNPEGKPEPSAGVQLTGDSLVALWAACEQINISLEKVSYFLWFDLVCKETSGSVLKYLM